MEKVPEEPDSPTKRTKIDMSLYGYKEPPKEEVIEFDGDFDKLFKQKPKTIKGMLTLMAMAFKKKLDSYKTGDA